MKQKLMAAMLAALFGFTKNSLASWGEFGDQVTWPAVKASTDMTALKYRVVRFDAAETCNIASNAVSMDKFEAAAGIVQNNPTSGHAATIAMFGPSKAVAGAAIGAREYITNDGSGMVIEAVSGNVVIGRAIEAAGAALDVISVMLFPPMRGGSAA